jgi:hypothetical protein
MTENLCAQYNPDRSDIWLECAGKKGNPYEIENWPHVMFLTTGCDAYYKLQNMYTLKNCVAEARVKKLTDMLYDIEKNGVFENPIILERPRIANQYNDGFEVYEGHHRLACCFVLGIECNCNLYRWESN